ncbi:MAG: glycosyl transferase [Bacilli bacterium]|nr:glycosyl transferase [Bacilli bacterium]
MTSEYKIPKIIHYCWFGKGEKSDLAKKCISGWRDLLKDYQIIEWNEDNFDINANLYVKEAYENKKYAFVSDYVRLYALLNYGGIYLDTDVELLNNFDKFLDLNAFVGFEDKELISTAIIGSKKNNLIIKEWFDSYKNRRFIENGKINDLTNVRVFTNLLLNYGLKQNNSYQKICEGILDIYPTEFFSPLKYGSKKPKITDNTITIHWFEGTWTTLSKKIKIKIIILIKSIIGFKRYNKLKKLLKC